MQSQNIALAPWTTLGVGGAAEHFFSAQTESEVVEVLRFAQENKLPLHVLGGGSNLVVADEGLRGVVLHMKTRGIELEAQSEEVLVHAQAGENWDAFTQQMTEAGLQGLECLGGIPGAVGATPIQNVGAYGQEVAESIESVRVVDRQSYQIHHLSAQECRFSYRNSFFKQEGRDRFIVLSVSYRLKRQAAPRIAYAELKRVLSVGAATPSLKHVRDTVIQLRKSKSMIWDPQDENGRSCGSFFVNVILSQHEWSALQARLSVLPPVFPAEEGYVKIPAAWLIENAGFPKGYQAGPVGLSTKHCLALVAHAGARARDVVRLAQQIRAGVQEKFGLELHPEPHFWGFSQLDRGLPVLPEEPRPSRIPGDAS